jgi:hypothetical protein
MFLDTKRKRRLAKEFLTGFFEGTAGGVTCGSIGWGWPLVAVLALLRGLQKLRKQYYLESQGAVEVAKPQTVAKKFPKTRVFFGNLITGASLGASAGVSYAHFFAPFTLGFSYLICAGMGAAIGAVGATLNYADNKWMMYKASP